ncbi:MAG: DUF3164 family protein [Balneolaceae bacterium]
MNTWKDPNGLEIPTNRITKAEKAEHRAAEQCFKLAAKASQALTEARNAIFDLVAANLEEVARYANLDGWKGNGFIRNFSDTIRIKKEYKKNVEPDNNINTCKQIVHECFTEFFKGSKKEAKELMNTYFQMDKAGRYNVKDLLKLKRADIDHPRWQEAMHYLDKSLTVTSSKAYFSVEYKDEMGQWHRLPLNFHEIIPDAVAEASKQSNKEAA